MTRSSRPTRAAWVEIDVARWRENLRLIRADMPPGLQMGYVVKEDALGHGLATAAGLAQEAGIPLLIVGCLEEAIRLREDRWKGRILLLGRVQDTEIACLAEYQIESCLQSKEDLAALAAVARRTQRPLAVHVEVNTGLNRYGVHWTEAATLLAAGQGTPGLQIAGTFSHFAQSDEPDKAFALTQLSRFQQVLTDAMKLGRSPGVRHLCNSGGYLDLPAAHFDLVRLGLLPCGVYPSATCRRIPGLKPVMSVRAKIAMVQSIAPGDHVGYGMRFTARRPSRIAVLPLGYGDGFPRVRNQGKAIVHGQIVPIVGGVATGAIFLDITDVPEARCWDVATLMGEDGDAAITANDVAALTSTVNYQILGGWRAKLPRIPVNA